MSTTYRIAVIAGDGIGQEVTAEGLKVLRAVVEPRGIAIETQDFDLGAGRYLATGEGLQAATISIVVKTLVLYTIMITGCIWEKVVFGKYLFAPAFFWEDFVSMFVLAIHTAYIGVLVFQPANVPARIQMYIALTAYAAYAINAAQFLLKLRAARLEGNPAKDSVPAFAEGAL